jgi:DNA-binding NtrC family response regulator
MKGAFTGANALVKGSLNSPAEGTSFSMRSVTSPQVAGDLLRVLQERRFYRVGGTRKLKSMFGSSRDQQDLAEEVHDGRFRRTCITVST